MIGPQPAQPRSPPPPIKSGNRSRWPPKYPRPAPCPAAPGGCGCVAFITALAPLVVAHQCHRTGNESIRYAPRAPGVAPARGVRTPARPSRAFWRPLRRRCGLSAPRRSIRLGAASIASSKLASLPETVMSNSTSSPALRACTAGQVMHASLRGAPKIASVGRRKCDGVSAGAITLKTGHAQRGKHWACACDAAAIGQDFSAAHNACGQSMHGCDQRAFQALGRIGTLNQYCHN